MLEHREARNWRPCARRQAIGRQRAQHEQEGQHAERHVDEEDHPPSGAGDQDAAERRAERGADGRHRAEESHRAARSRLWNRVTDEGDGERQHDRRAESLERPGHDEHDESRRGAAQKRGRREQGDPEQQQPATAKDVAEPPDADDERGDGDEVGEDDPLHLLEGGPERRGEGGQADVGDARVERRHEHRKRQAGERPSRG